MKTDRRIHHQRIQQRQNSGEDHQRFPTVPGNTGLDSPGKQGKHTDQYLKKDHGSSSGIINASCILKHLFAEYHLDNRVTGKIDA